MEAIVNIRKIASNQTAFRALTLEIDNVEGSELYNGVIEALRPKSNGALSDIEMLSKVSDVYIGSTSPAKLHFSLTIDNYSDKMHTLKAQKYANYKEISDALSRKMKEIYKFTSCIAKGIPF